jgi:hypothetical protein
MMVMDDDEAQQYALDATQTQQEVLNEATMHATSPSKAGGTGAAGTKPRSDAWGLVRRKGGNQEEFLLEHRLKDGKRDTYVIGRSTKADIVVNDGRVSAHHCAVYCDYSEARLRVFIEDMSANGTFVNDSLIRLTKGKRLELKTGDEIFLVNPRTLESRPGGTGNSAAFLYINLRERMFVERTIGYAPSSSSAGAGGGGYGNTGGGGGRVGTRSGSAGAAAPASPHFEDLYVIGDQLGSGMSGQVHLCMCRQTREHCAVKIIDTRKFALTPGLSPRELREEADMMRGLDHPNIIRIKDTFETDRLIFIVMELVRGGDLFDRIVEKGA